MQPRRQLVPNSPVTHGVIGDAEQLGCLSGASKCLDELANSHSLKSYPMALDKSSPRELGGDSSLNRIGDGGMNAVPEQQFDPASRSATARRMRAIREYADLQ